MNRDNPILVDNEGCPDCAGDDVKREACPTCLGHGLKIFTTCPYSTVSNETAELIDLCGHAQDGFWPVAGGMLDQCYSFVEAYRTYRASKHGRHNEEKG